MKNRKGFTLIEFLAVILLISIILIIAIPAISNIRKSIMIRELESKKEAIVSAAEVYAQNNQSLFPKEGGIIQIPVRTLVYYGYINEDSTDCDDAIGCVMNPVNNTSMNNEIISIKKIKSVTQATFGEVNEHVITFHANGATSVGGSSNFISIGCDTFTNSTCTIRVPSIERDGFTKVGFGESANSTTADYLVGQDILFNDNISNNGVKSDYYAITSKGVAVTFYPNTGTFINGESSIVRTCTIRNTATNCSVASQEPSVTKLGYNKKSGWYTTSSGSTTIDISKVTSNASAYAHWTANKYTVTFNVNGGNAWTSSTCVSPYTFTSNESKCTKSVTYADTYGSMPAPTRAGHSFQGWYTANLGGTKIETSTSVSITSAQTLYAQWKENCSQGGTYNSLTGKCEYDAIITKTYCGQSALLNGYTGSCTCIKSETDYPSLMACQSACTSGTCNGRKCTITMSIPCGSYNNCSDACDPRVATGGGTCTPNYKCGTGTGLTGITLYGTYCLATTTASSCPSDWGIRTSHGINGHDYGCNYNTHTLNETTCSYTP